MRFFVVLTSFFLSLSAQADVFATTSFQMKLFRQSIYQAKQAQVAQTGQILVRYNYSEGICYVLARRGDIPCHISMGPGSEFLLSLTSDALYQILIGDLQWTDSKFFGEFQTAWPKQKDLTVQFGSFDGPAPATVSLVSSLDIKTADSKVVYLME